MHVLVESYQVVMYSVHSSSQLGGRDGGRIQLKPAASNQRGHSPRTYGVVAALVKVMGVFGDSSVWPSLALWPFGPRWRSGTGEWCVLQNAYQRLSNASPKRRLGFQPWENGRGNGIGNGKSPSRHRAARSTTYSTVLLPAESSHVAEERKEHKND